MAAFSMDKIEKGMDASVEALKKEFAGLRTGRASTSMLDPLMVDAYGSKMPMAQVGTVGAPEPRLLTIQVWDNGLVQAVEKAIRDSSLGLNPNTEGQLIRLPIPDLSEERRKELVKVAGQYAEQSRISVRNVRREGMDGLKAQEKEGDISEDEHHHLSDQIQKLTDTHVKTIDEMLATKEADIMHV